MKGEKPLRTTVNFSIEHARPREAYVKTSLVSEETLGIVIFLEFHSTKQGLPLVDSWSRGLD